MNTSQMSNDFHTLIDVCSRARLVILADDKASDELTGWFAQQIAMWDQKKIHLLLNHKDYIQNMNFTMLDSEVEAVLTIVKLVEEGKKVAVQTAYGNRDDKPDMEKIVNAVRKLTGLNEHEVMGWHSGSFSDDSSGDNVRDNPNKVIPDLIDRGLRVAIFSPVNSVGWSYSVSDPHYVFDAVVNIYGWIGISAPDIKQGTRRWRLTEDHWVYISPQQKRIAEDAVESSFEAEGFVESDEPFAKLQKTLLKTYNNRQESVRSHFISHIENLGGGFWLNRFDYHDREIAAAKKVLKVSNTQAVTKGIEVIKRNKEVLEHFGQFCFEDGKPKLKPLKSLDGFSDAQLKNMNRSLQKLTAKNAQNLVDLWSMDSDTRKLISDEEEAAFYYLHGQLLDAVNNLLSPYFSEGICHLLEWIVSDENESLEFHMENTAVADQFKEFVRQHQTALKISAFTDLGSKGGWIESPFKIIKAICKSLHLQVKEKEKLSGMRGGKRIADECKKNLVSEYKKRGLLKLTLSDREKKKILMKSVIEKKSKRLPMSKAEKDYFNSIGRRIEIRKSDVVPSSLYQEIISIYHSSEEDIHEL